uniref:Uncharacterized protein n=1 Tax=Arundo donax TaxID=35708 RepID=A0A0A9GF79_ARUDO
MRINGGCCIGGRVVFSMASQHGLQQMMLAQTFIIPTNHLTMLIIDLEDGLGLELKLFS